MQALTTSILRAWLGRHSSKHSQVCLGEADDFISPSRKNRPHCKGANSIAKVDDLLSRAQPVDESTPLADLRKWRSELVQASVFASFAIGVLTLDANILSHGLSTPSDTDLQSLVDNLPHLLATGWIGGGWSLSPDAVESVVAADNLTKGYARGLLGLHAQIVSSDLRDPQVINELLDRIKEEKFTLINRRVQLEERVRNIQNVMLDHYEAGTASVDDWLN